MGLYRNRFGFNFSPTLGRLVSLAVLLTLVAQIVLLYIGLSYARSIERSIDEKKAETILNQFQQSTLYQLNDINNLLQLLQTPEFSDYFKSYMKLRDPATADAANRLLQNKINELNLSASIVNEIYFIGTDRNQYSFRKVIGTDTLEQLPHLYMDLLQYAKLDTLFLKSHDQLTLYTDDVINENLDFHSKLLSVEDIGGVREFASRMKNRLIITNGNVNGVLIVIVLDNHFFDFGLPKSGTQDAFFSVVAPDKHVIWSQTSDHAAQQAIAAGQSQFVYDKDRYTNLSKNLPPFDPQLIYSFKEGEGYFSQSALYVKMFVLSLVTLLVSLLISLFYLKHVFKPFRAISRRLRNQALTGEKMLQEIPEETIGHGIHLMSLRNKLILLFSAAVMIPTISDGLLYSQFSSQAVQAQLNKSMKDIGDFSGVNVSNRVKYFENLINELSVSQKFQAYLSDQTVYSKTSVSSDDVTISMFPGLNEVSYFVLLDEDGNAIYSSIFSNNKDIFQTETKYLNDQNKPYWISEYEDVFNHTTTAVVKRIQPTAGNNAATYLLLVPKDSVFEDVGYGMVNTYYSISDESGKVIYQSRLYPEDNQSFLRFAEKVPDTGWQMTIEYADYDIIDKNREYQSQFLLIILIVSLLSMAGSFLLAEIMTRPIRRLKQMMAEVGNGNFETNIDYVEHNEIGDIVRSFNKMVRQLDREIQENARINEENAYNKIRENDLIAMKTRAELLMLQAQINPHFLYNTLEAIKMRSMKNNDREIGVMVNALADMFRYSISRENDLVELRQELKHVNDYVLIQQMRFGRSFELEYQVDERLTSLRVLKFILQPIVENAIKHGFEGWEHGGIIRISAEEEDGWIRLAISDNGNGMNERKLEQLNRELKEEVGSWQGKDGGIGLRNVYHRLRLFYHNRIEMTVSSALMRGTTISIEMPTEDESLTNAIEI